MEVEAEAEAAEEGEGLGFFIEERKDGNFRATIIEYGVSKRISKLELHHRHRRKDCNRSYDNYNHTPFAGALLSASVAKMDLLFWA